MTSLGGRKQHSTFWFLDGSVIIEIEDVLFSFSRSRLPLASPFFEASFVEGEPSTEIREIVQYIRLGMWMF
jgi:hypothetical protein